LFGKRRDAPHGNLKPSPLDDRTPSGWFDGGGQNGSADDDDTAISPWLRPRLVATPNGNTLASYYPSIAPLDGRSFKIGYQVYAGISEGWPMQRGANDSTIGRPIVMRPPLIPFRSASPMGVRNAISFVQSMPYETWMPIVPPMVSRR
jgi:hypothetical protein